MRRKIISARTTEEKIKSVRDSFGKIINEVDSLDVLRKLPLDLAMQVAARSLSGLNG